jgi:hypothetical protein
MRQLSPASTAIAILCTSLPGLAWSGPQATLANKNGRKVLQICDQGGGCQTSTPFMMAVRSTNYPIALYEAQLAINWLNPGNGVVPVVHLTLHNDPADQDFSNQEIDTAIAQLNTLSVRPYLYIRFKMTAPAGVYEPSAVSSMQGDVQSDNTVQETRFALSESWLAFQESELQRILLRFDAGYPGRLLGVNVGYELGGEWFNRPVGVSGGAIQPSSPQGAPWVSDAARQTSYLYDYSSTTQTGFCAWTFLPASLRTGCRAATVAERDNASAGTPPGPSRGVFLDPADPGSLRAAYYNRFVSEQNVKAIIRMLTLAKSISGNRLLTSAFYGYQTTGLDWALSTSGQNALTTLLASSAVDIVAGPYSYDPAGSRALGSPLQPQGISDSPKLSGKLWFTEDDTRTFFATSVTDTTKQVTTLWDSIRILRRNLISAALHNTGSWFLDLGPEGWFGRADMDADSQNLWANLTNAFNAMNKIQLNSPNPYNAQVAVFTDDLSANYVAAFTPAGVNSFQFGADLGFTLYDKLSRLGTPVKRYLLSDLLNPNLDLSFVKLAVLPNAWNVPANIRSAIDTRLRTAGRTLLFVYAAGYMNDDGAASAGNISAFTGINVAAGAGTPTLQESFNVNGIPVSGGLPYSITPWFRISDAGAGALATYSVAGGTSLARKAIPVAGGSYSSVLAAAPTLPLEMLRKISEDAGVFHFSDAGDSVEAAGNMVMIHSATDSISKTFRFPGIMPRILETGLYPSDVLMCSSCSVLSSQSISKGDTRIFRWTAAPIGNFELISGTTVSGWAMDTDVPDQSIAINVYAGAPFGQGGTFLAGFSTTAPRADVAAAFGTTLNHGFSQTLPSCPHGTMLYAYALDPESGGDGSTMIGSHACP